MWVPSTWETDEDVAADIQLLAEYTSSDCEVEIPRTILEYRKHMSENKMKPLNSDIDDHTTFVISGRGKGQHDRVVRPGGLVDCHPEDEVELKKQIRQVAGFGYSNEIIEHSIKCKVNAKGPGKSSDEEVAVRFVSCSNCSKSSSSDDLPKSKTE